MKHCRRYRVTLVGFVVLIVFILFINYNLRDQNVEERIISDREFHFINAVKRNRYNLDCQLILEGNKQEISKAEKIFEKIKNEIGPSEANFTFSSNQCSQFRRLRGYDDHPVTTIELDFPLAFIILTYKDIEQFERLLRVIYRPHNVYCIHVDGKSPPEFHKAIKSIVQCFDNVFIASKLERIVYAGYSRLQADLNCMNDLLDAKYTLIDPTKKQVKWKYLFNLASTEFPLKTNYEIVRILNIYNGANDIEVMKNYIESRVFKKWIEKDGDMVETKIKKVLPPHNFTLVKGLAYGVFSNSFINYTLNNKYSRDLLEWLKDTYSPDESYWATLQHNTQFNPPGGYKDDWKLRSRVNTTSRWIIWFGDIYECYGGERHGICVFSLRDLPFLVTRREYFVNKLELKSNPIVYQCMEEWIGDKEESKAYIRVNDYCHHPVLKVYNTEFYCDSHNYFMSLMVL